MSAGLFSQDLAHAAAQALVRRLRPFDVVNRYVAAPPIKMPAPISAEVGDSQLERRLRIPSQPRTAGKPS